MTDRSALPPSFRIWRGPPLLFQILALLIGGLLVAQLVTLFLTLVLPPAPTPSHKLEDIALALRTGAASPHDLQRSVQSAPPTVSGRGWLVSETAATDLARMVEVPRANVRLFFYSPIPFASGRPSLASTQDGAGEAWMQGLFVVQARAEPNGQGGARQGGSRPGGMDGRAGGGAMPGGMGMGRTPGDGRFGQMGLPGADGVARRDGASTTSPGADRPAAATRGWRDMQSRPGSQGGEGLPSRIDRQEHMPPRDTPVATGQSGPPAPNRPTPGSQAPGRIVQSLQGAPFFTGQSLFPETFGQQAAPNPIPEQPETVARPEPVRARPEAPGLLANAPSPAAAVTPKAAPPVATNPVLPDVQSIPTDATAEPGAKPLTPITRPDGLFGLAPAPFVQGDFVAAMRLPDGRWSVVQLAAEPFPNTWQRRVLLWFLCALALVTPLGWIFARRLVKPLIGFAQAAEQLGRDPTAPVLALGDGPAEVGRAARAFNQMQSRLRSFVDDRTAMVGAISHDLRTPLTRLRFRIEDVEDEARRDGMIAEVEEMEAMISSVLDFIREGSTHGAREYVDLPSLVGEMAEGWTETGADVHLTETDGEDVVDVDRLAVRRLIGNLVENAIKYGARAKIRIWNDGQEAFVDVVDEGTGIAADEQERVFEPFYRTAEARASAKAGSGLGLAVCRSIARTHGGDVQLFFGAMGFTARLRLPLAFGHAGKLAA